MANIPVYTISQSTMSQLSLAMQAAGLHLQSIGTPRANAEGTEQNWKCWDATGDLFFFGTAELKDKNGLRLKTGTLCLIGGPGAQGRQSEQINAAFAVFEVTLLGLGAQKAQ